MIPAGAVTWQSLPVAIWREYEGAAVAPSDHPTLV
ncbi:MAG: hypothetical protein QOJ72_931, partial [Nocardioidaceae bacterium]|nr:hypothetical protein [Nocardioidaceae bacterium]